MIVLFSVASTMSVSPCGSAPVEIGLLPDRRRHCRVRRAGWSSARRCPRRPSPPSSPCSPPCSAAAAVLGDAPRRRHGRDAVEHGAGGRSWPRRPLLVLLVSLAAVRLCARRASRGPPCRPSARATRVSGGARCPGGGDRRRPCCSSPAPAWRSSPRRDRRRVRPVRRDADRRPRLHPGRSLGLAAAGALAPARRRPAGRRRPWSGSAPRVPRGVQRRPPQPPARAASWPRSSCSSGSALGTLS